MDQFISFPFVVGANWHRWADYYVPGNSSHQIDAGPVQCGDPVHRFTAGTRWDASPAATAGVNGGICDQISAKTGGDANRSFSASRLQAKTHAPSLLCRTSALALPASS